VAELAAFVRTEPEHDLADHPAWSLVPDLSVAELTPEETQRYNIIGVPEIAAEDLDTWTVGELAEIVEMVRSIADVCDLEVVNEVLDSAPAFGLLHQGTLPFAGREGTRLWNQLVETIAERWDDVIDAIDDMIDTPEVDTTALAGKLIRLRCPRKLPVVLSSDEVARLIAATTCLKHRAALSVAYGAGLRVAEVASLKVGDIDSQRMLIRVERGKGGRARQAMLSPDLLGLLRAWWKEGRRQGVMLPGGWLFPGQNPDNPITTRQLHRVVQEAARAAGIARRVGPHTLRHSFATHLLEDGVDIRVIQALLGHAKLDNTALYTRVATRTVRAVTSPLDRITALLGERAEAGG